MEHFRKLGLNEELLEQIKKLGFEKPTEIQEKTIPLVLEGKDIIGGSATGSGKTLAFGAPIIQNCHRKGGIQALILTPTRELAEQIYGVLRSITKLSVTAVYGGVSINQQMRNLERTEIVVATPGRLLDHLERRTIDLSFIRYVVLDEADRMLDMGFIDDVRQIISQCPKEKQMLLFSATIPPEVAKLSQNFMKTPVKVKVSDHVDPTKLTQVYYDTTSSLKFSLLAHLLKEEDTGLVMVFCNSRKYVDVVAKNLNKIGIPSMGIHGGLTQYQRSNVLEKFNSKTTYVLVCTDVAARGLDIGGVSHVYNYDIPQDSRQYIHRIGRTARAGKSGKVINLISSRDYEGFSAVLKDSQLKVTKMEKPFVQEIKIDDRSQGTRGQSDGRFGNRDSNRGPPRGAPRSRNAGGNSQTRRSEDRRESRGEHSRSNDGERSNNDSVERTPRKSNFKRDSNRMNEPRSNEKRQPYRNNERPNERKSFSIND
jgi:ATP-dependent RNA helicase DeaD